MGRRSTVLFVSGVRRSPLAEEGVNTVAVAPQCGEGQRSPAHVVSLVHVPLPLSLQQDLQSLSMAVISLQGATNPNEVFQKLQQRNLDFPFVSK